MIYPIVKFPDPILQQPAEPVTVFDAELRQLVDDMFTSMYDAQGIGLAAPQIGVSKRLTVIDLSFQKKPEDKIVLINPEVVEIKGKQVEEEGCLSLPEIRDRVVRAAEVKVRAQDADGKPIEVEGTELLARALQHEIDHLDGILFIFRLSRLKRDLQLRKIRKLQKAPASGRARLLRHACSRRFLGAMFKPMRLVFCGTPQFAVPTLEALLQAGHRVELVLSQPDRASGRGMEVQFSPSNTLPSSVDLRSTQPEKIRNNPDLQNGSVNWRRTRSLSCLWASDSSVDVDAADAMEI